MQGTKTNRERKNGASREEWQKRKTEANAARPKQHWTGTGWVRG
jgi:hypothetical protein